MFNWCRIHSIAGIQAGHLPVISGVITPTSRVITYKPIYPCIRPFIGVITYLQLVGAHFVSLENYFGLPLMVYRGERWLPLSQNVRDTPYSSHTLGLDLSKDPPKAKLASGGVCLGVLWHPHGLGMMDSSSRKSFSSRKYKRKKHLPGDSSSDLFYPQALEVT